MIKIYEYRVTGHYITPMLGNWGRSFKSVMTVMPAVAHCSRRASKSNMFVCPRYNTGRMLRSVAMANTVSAGDGF